MGLVLCIDIYVVISVKLKFVRKNNGSLETAARTQMSTGGSVVEFSPATREARVRFPASAELLYASFTFQIFCN